MAATQDNRNIRVKSALGADTLLLHRMAGRDGLSELGAYQLDLLSEQADLAIDAVLGQALSLMLDVAPGVVRELNGIVTRFVVRGRAGRAGRYTSYQATVRPWLWLLTQSRDCRIFQDQDAVAIIKTIFEKYALADYDLGQLSSTPPVLPYCVQYRESDFAFVSRLMERFGIYWYFRHAGGRHTLVLADSAAAHSPISGSAGLHFASDGDPRARSRETVYQWQAGGEILADAVTLQAFNFETPAVDLTAKSTQARGYDGNARELELYDYPGAYLVRGAGEAEAKTRVESAGAGQHDVTGAATAAALAPGSTFELLDHPRSDQNVDMLVVSASYQIYSDRFEAEPGLGPVDKDAIILPFDCQFRAVAKAATYRAARATGAPIMHGPQTAIVVGKSGEEIWTDKYGRVRIKFHWDRIGDGDSDADACSCWVRVAQAWAGKRFGQLLIPRIGQEVVVSFLEGDPDQPLVTGAVYNAQNMPPVSLPDDATQSTFKTNSSKGGGGFNELRFEDKKGSEEVFVQAEKDYRRIVKNNDTLKVGFEKADAGDQTIDIKNNQTVDVGAAQAIKAGTTIVIEAGTSIELKVGGSSIKIEAGKITIKAPEIEIAADANAKVKAGAMMEIKSGAIMTIGGALVQIN
ncbi:type VI secretion system Vgr family protein [Massilia sp. S19_KUP03_FR1]|uniref:type VI secretion system Vgr family protein n=1 Tax=Massilia sp. S19_KUP03_FR1 TaxID=3025503 RepID=UPI002FCD9FEB